jgi:hypothetical protein
MVGGVIATGAAAFPIGAVVTVGVAAAGASASGFEA